VTAFEGGKQSPVPSVLLLIRLVGIVAEYEAKCDDDDTDNPNSDCPPDGVDLEVDDAVVGVVLVDLCSSRMTALTPASV